MLKYKGRLYVAYKPAPKSLRASKRNAIRAIKFFERLVERAKDPHIKYFAKDVLWSADNLIARLSILSKYLLDEEDFQRFHEYGSLTQLIDMLDSYTTQTNFESLLRRLGDVKEDAEKSFNADLPYQFGDLKQEYEMEYQDNSFDEKIVPFVEALFKVPDYIKAYQKYVDDLKSNQEYSQHAFQFRDRKRDPHPPGVEETEVVWHATTAYPKIIKEGFKLRSQLEGTGGLGGSMTTGEGEGISFTGNYEIAEGITEAFSDMAKLMQGDRRYETFWNFAKELELPDETLENYTDLGRLSPGDVIDDDYRAFDLARNIMGQASVIGNYYDPLFMSEQGALQLFKMVQPKDIGIIEATINTTHPDTTYLRSMDEWRVPLDAILDSGPVGSQHHD